MITREDWDKDSSLIDGWNQVRLTPAFKTALELAKEETLAWRQSFVDVNAHALLNAKREGAIEMIRFFELLHRPPAVRKEFPAQFTRPLPETAGINKP